MILLRIIHSVLQTSCWSLPHPQQRWRVQFFSFWVDKEVRGRKIGTSSPLWRGRRRERGVHGESSFWGVCLGFDCLNVVFWSCAGQFPSVRLCESPEVPSLLACDKCSWPRCLLWHVWLPLLAPRRIGSPLAAISDSVEAAFGVWSCFSVGYQRGTGRTYLSCLMCLTSPTSERMAVGTKTLMRWLVLRVLSAFVLAVPWVMDTLKARIWRRMLPGFFPRSLTPCRRFWGRSIWEVIISLQTLMPLHLGIDSKNVCDKVGRLLGIGHKVKGHATDDVVVDGRVRGDTSGMMLLMLQRNSEGLGSKIGWTKLDETFSESKASDTRVCFFSQVALADCWRGRPRWVPSLPCAWRANAHCTAVRPWSLSDDVRWGWGRSNTSPLPPPPRAVHSSTVDQRTYRFLTRGEGKRMVPPICFLL